MIDPKTGKPGGAVYASTPCLGSRWGAEYLRKVRTFIERAGLDLFENDGSYPGDVCALDPTSRPSRRWPTRNGRQWKKITELYRWCRGRGVYLNVPDWYFLNGSNKVFLGYREENWTLPRDAQVLLSRQNIFDGTWQKTPSMGWSFLPLVNYKGGGPAALIEPLCRASRRVRGPPGPEFRRGDPVLLPRLAPVRYRGHQGGREEVGRLLQEVPPDPRFRHHPRPPPRCPRRRLHAARQSAAEAERPGHGLQPAGSSGQDRP